jgi:hypothetical protein
LRTVNLRDLTVVSVQKVVGYTSKPSMPRCWFDPDCYSPHRDAFIALGGFGTITSISKKTVASGHFVLCPKFQHPVMKLVAAFKTRLPLCVDRNIFCASRPVFFAMSPK